MVVVIGDDAPDKTERKAQFVHLRVAVVAVTH